MKKMLVLVPMAVLMSYCGTTQSASGKGTASKRFVRTGTEVDSVVVTGTQYIPILGKNEAGVRPELKGTWVLQSMPGSTVGGKTSTNIINQTAQELEAAKRTGEKRDTIVTKTKTGVATTETTLVYIEDGRGNKITPPQGSNYHIPETPSLNFYGSNDTYAGFTGCNKISGRFSVSGTNSINFKNATASTKMVCIGDYDEQAFINSLQRVNTFKAESGQLQLMEGDKVVLVFSKK